jgi:hypothetical protein
VALEQLCPGRAVAVVPSTSSSSAEQLLNVSASARSAELVFVNVTEPTTFAVCGVALPHVIVSVEPGAYVHVPMNRVVSSALLVQPEATRPVRSSLFMMGTA